MAPHSPGRRALVWLVLAALGLAACRTIATPPTATPLPAVTATATTSPPPPATPTATEVPLAASVNGQPITEAAYQKEVARYEAALGQLGRDPAAAGDYHTLVLNELINRELVAQAAVQMGITVDEAEVQVRYDDAVQAAGGQEAFDAWLAANQYSPDEFRAEVLAGLAAQAVAAQVVNVPTTAEQVHARHILLTDENDAQTVLALLQSGSDFATLAQRYSRDLSTRLNGGDLGWFYRGKLTVPEVEDMAFNLQPNEISGIIQSSLGFHIVQTLERDPARPLDASYVATERQEAFDTWLAAQRAAAAVEVYSQ